MNETVWAGAGFGNPENVATTDWAAIIVAAQLPVPLHPAPLHAVNADPLAGVAVRVTTAPLANDALHVVPQLIPTGLLVTVPPPLPAVVTLSVYGGGTVKAKPALEESVTLTVTY